MSSTMYSCYSQLKRFEEGNSALCKQLCYLATLDTSPENDSLFNTESRGYCRSIVDQLWNLKSRSCSNLEKERLVLFLRFLHICSTEECRHAELRFKQ